MDCTGTIVKTEPFTRYTESQGLPSSAIQGHSGRQSRAGFGSALKKGISRFDPQTETFRNYDVSDGLQSDEFSDGCYPRPGWRDVLWRQQWV